MYEQYMLGTPYLKEAVPNMDSIAGAKEYRLRAGAGNYVSAVELYTGSGLTICVYPERGMDIGEVHFRGVPVSFVSKTGVKDLKNVVQTEFSRNFFAGMVTTCGLDNVGSECVIDGNYYPTHGRINITAAEEYHIKKYWEGKEYYVELIGKVRIASLFGENLVLLRSIKIRAGESKVYLFDQIINEGYVKQGYMLLYHCNFGYPIVSDNSRVLTNHRKVEYLDEQSRKFGREHSDIEKPMPGFLQSAFMLSKPKEERVKAAIVNDALRLGVYLECNENQLGKFCQWVNLASQDYVIGLEPAKNDPVGRAKALEDHTINWIDPQDKHEVALEFGILDESNYNQYICLMNETVK